MRRLPLILVLFCFLSFPLIAQQAKSQDLAATPKAAEHPVRLLDWDTYVDKVQGAWMGKMIGVTFGQPWEFQYQNTPIGFDITDWPLSPTRMKDYRARARNKPGQDEWNPITREADNQKIVILHSFIEA